MVETNMTEMNGISTSDKQDGVEIIYLWISICWHKAYKNS